MKAITYHTYGAPDVLAYEEIEKPVPGRNDVLIKVVGAAVNPADWHFMRGTPYPVRLVTGLRKPKRTTLGVDVAGVVETIGANVTRFKPGDAVFGGCRGAFAEYVTAPECGLVIKPEAVTFEQAGSVAVAALTALQALRDHGRLREAQSVLINGAAGGVGTFAVQIAKSFGAHVTGVCSARNVDMVRGIGADRVIDYSREDFSKGAQRYDVILDCMGNRSLSAFRHMLTSHGRYIAVGGPTGPWMVGALTRMLRASVISACSRRKLIMMLGKLKKDDLAIVGDLIATARVTPVIDRRHALQDLREAIRYLEKGHAHGKVVIAFGPPVMATTNPSA